jgi:uncharacterized protein YlxW (UPF0749 family)
MNGDPRASQEPDPPEDDVVVPHPFGSGSLGERPPADRSGEAQESPEAQEPESRAAESRAAEVEDAEDPTGTVEPGTDAAAAGASSEPVEDDDAPVVAAATEPGPGEGQEVTEPGKPSARRRRDPLAAALIGLLTLLLGFAFAVQVRTVGQDEEYAGAREEDLVGILDNLNAQEQRLRDQIADQRSALQQLSSSDSRSAAALEEARARAEAIGILNGTIAAQGPGLLITVRDPDDVVRVSDVLDAIQELRGAGAETMQIDGVRVGVSTAITGTPGDLMVDGRPITAPYDFVVIGSPQNMETALNIPGGVVQDLTRQGASVVITQSQDVVVDALRPLDTPQYASPDTGG